jgi:D-glycero-D-manno-heptose 1,7-bisphosphate phosphatase
MNLKEMIDASWTLFLDRDGVINQRDFSGYIQKKEQFYFEEGVLDFLKFASFHFGKIIVVTNQQGVGKGLMSLNALESIHECMISEINKAGGRIDAVYVATNLKNADNDRRKPLSVMGLEAQNTFPEIDFSKSIMIGDTDSDLKFGKKLGMITILKKSKEKISMDFDFEVSNLRELIFN